MPIEAFIFDLDGVVTDTATAHRTSWKNLFDSYLSQREKKYHEPFVPFDPEKDYLSYVDGRPRYEGVKTFLLSRKILLPEGSSKDPPERETVCGLGNKKNALFQENIRKNGVPVFEPTLQFINELKKREIKVGMATSSKNGPLLLKRAHLENIFEATVDGNESQKFGLRGKPHPDIFLECAKRLSVEPKNCAVVEDAISGVQAGKSGRFGLTLGIAKTNSIHNLIKNGADLAVESLDEVPFSDIENLFNKKRS